MKILCVDDDVNILQALSRMLQMAGLEVLAASSAQMGLEFLAADKTIAVVISDYQMPETNGVTFLREVCHNWPETGRILITGNSEILEVRLAVAEGLIQQLADKPWEETELLAMVAPWLEPPPSKTLSYLSI